MNIFIYWMLFSLNILSFTDQSGSKATSTFKPPEYDLSSPDKVLVLPAALKEISGITEVDVSAIACIQDENGIVFIHDINKNRTIRQFIFGGVGDYEDIARVNNNLYVLRSDEVLNEIINYPSDDFKREAYLIKIPGKDCEGLCYDRKNNRLLIVPKEISGNIPENKGNRFIYGFDLATKKLIKGPVLKFELKEIKSFTIENKIKTPMKGKKGEKQEPDIELRISALGIHPLTGRLFALSGTERMLFVFNIDGKIEFLTRLDKNLFPQPEGIAFLKNGDMLISNEGRNGTPTLIRFNYKPRVSSKSGY